MRNTLCEHEALQEAGGLGMSSPLLEVFQQMTASPWYETPAWRPRCPQWPLLQPPDWRVLLTMRSERPSLNARGISSFMSLRLHCVCSALWMWRHTYIHLHVRWNYKNCPHFSKRKSPQTQETDHFHLSQTSMHFSRANTDFMEWL